jgi:hypothetical protein
MKQFYVYIHKKPDGTPFYVGKGHGKRAYKLNGRNPHHQAILDKYAGQVVIEITNCETEKAAFELEKIYVKQLRDQGYRLANMTDGGEGMCGFKLDPAIQERVNAINRTKVRSDEFKAMVSAQWKGVKRGEPSPVHKQRNAEAKKGNTFRRGAKHTPEAIQKMSASQTGKRWTEQQKQSYSIKKLGVAHKNRGSGLAGVNWVKGMSKWRVTTTLFGKTTIHGWFDNLLDAAACRMALHNKINLL